MRFVLSVLMLALSVPAFAAEPNCDNAVIAPAGAEIFGDQTIEIDCRLTQGPWKFPVIFAVNAGQGGDADAQYSVSPILTNSGEAFRIVTDKKHWCSDDAGIVELEAEIDCEKASGEYSITLQSGSVFSSIAKIQVTPKK